MKNKKVIEWIADIVDFVRCILPQFLIMVVPYCIPAGFYLLGWSMLAYVGFFVTMIGGGLFLCYCVFSYIVAWKDEWVTMMERMVICGSITVIGLLIGLFLAFGVGII